MSIKNKNDWCFRFFNSPDYVDIYHDMTGPDRTEKEIQFCERVLQWQPGQRILDAPCGAGRHSLALARRGFSPVGVDFSSYLLLLAQCGIPRFSFRRPKPVFTRGLLQQLPFQNDSFDFIICLFSSFGYGECEDDNLTVMSEFARVLRPGGKVLIDVMNRHFIVPRLNPVFESVQSNLCVREERTITDNGRRLQNCIQVQDKDGNKRIYYYRPWLFNGWELSWLAARAGLKSMAIYGNFYAEEYQDTSERAMMVAVKPMIPDSP